MDSPAALSDLDLLRLEFEARYVLAPVGRLLRVNEPDGGPAPRFFLGLTRGGNAWRFCAGLDPALVSELDAIAAREPIVSDLEALPQCTALLEEALSRHEPVTRREAGPAFRFPEQVEHIGGVIDVGKHNAGLIAETFPELHAILEVRLPCVAVVRDGAAVSVCYCSRRTPAAAEAGVDTLEGYRRQGFAAAVTAGWAIRVRELGLVPLYSTSWDNLASRGVARRLGLIQYAADLHFT